MRRRWEILQKELDGYETRSSLRFFVSVISGLKIFLQCTVHWICFVSPQMLHGVFSNIVFNTFIYSVAHTLLALSPLVLPKLAQALFNVLCSTIMFSLRFPFFSEAVWLWLISYQYHKWHEFCIFIQVEYKYHRRTLCKM